MRLAASVAFLVLCPLGCGSQPPLPAAAPAVAVVVARPPPPPPPPPPSHPVWTADVPTAVEPSAAQSNVFLRESSLDSVAGANLAVTRFGRDLEAAGGQCPIACRALGSMDRAAGRLCSLATSADEKLVCAEAKAKLLAARAKVRQACGACPNGTVVDPDAPCPSP
jgi:hypothetical protein